MDGAFAGPRVAMCLRRMGVDIGPAGTVGEVSNSTQYSRPGQLSFKDAHSTPLGKLWGTSTIVVANSSSM